MTASSGHRIETWATATFRGRPLIEALAERDITTLFAFLSARGWSRASLAAATGLSETRVRSVLQGRQQVTSYLVLERIAEGLGIDRGLMGLAYLDASGNDCTVPVSRAARSGSRRAG
jgi:transcriptional regulator with XRE-family HTH domain